MKPKKIKTNLMDCHEVQIHYKRPLYDTKKRIKGSESANSILRSFIDTKRIDLKEFFWVILLTNANQVIGVSEIGMGCAKGVMVNTKEVCQLALLTNASGIIVAHNHPSGTLKPSQQDKDITKKLTVILDILDVALLDHLIITTESFASFSDNNWM